MKNHPMTLDEAHAMSRTLTFAERALVDTKCECPADAKRGERCTRDAMRCNGRLNAWLDACREKLRAARKAGK